MIEFGKELACRRTNKKLYVSKDGQYLIKDFLAEEVSKAKVLAEAVSQARVEETGKVTIPALEEVFKHGDDWCIAYKFVKGKTLQELMDENTSEEKKYLEKMVDLQIETQKVSVETLPSLTEKLQQRISLSKDYIDATIRYELHVRLDAMPKHTKLCHCDFNPTNILIGEDKKVYITDWAHAAKGNASADAAYTYMWFKEKGRKDLADLYLSLFCKKTDTALQYVQRFMPIVAAALVYKVKPEEKEILLAQANVVEYQ